MKKFLLIDDHFVVRSGVKGFLAELYKPCEIYEADDSAKAIALLKQRSYDLVIMDVQIPKNDMLGLMEYIHIRYPDAKVLMFSMSPENIYAKRFLKAGAKGFLSKDSTFEETIKAINLVLANRKYISETLAERLAEDSMADHPNSALFRQSENRLHAQKALLLGLLCD